MHSSSFSDTRAGPSCTSEKSPATLRSAPLGARLPLSTTTPPAGEIALLGARITSPSGSGAPEHACASVSPPMVGVCPSICPLLNQCFRNHRHAAHAGHV